MNSCSEYREEFPERSLRVTLAKTARKVKLDPKEKESKRHCKEHQEDLKLFCETDRTWICVICRHSREHREHRFIPIKEAIENCKEQASSLQTHITSEFTKMHQILTEKEWRLLRDLREGERILEPVEKNLRKIQEKLNAIEEELSNLQKQIEEEDTDSRTSGGSLPEEK
eukprot:g30137.t1